MKDRLYKFLMMLVAVPVIWMMLFVVASMCLALPAIALMFPEKITIDKKE